MKKLLIILFLSFMQDALAQNGFQKLYGGAKNERAQSVFSYSGGYVVSGATNSFGSSYFDICLFRTNAIGQVLWSKTYGNNGYENSEYAIETFDHNIVCSGVSEITAGISTAIIFKTDSNGNMLWSKCYGLNLNCSFANIIETNDRGYAAIGTINNSGSKDIYFVRTNSNGDTLFSKSYATPDDEIGFSVMQVADSSFYICGRLVTASTESQSLLMHTDPSGNVLWMNRYGIPNWTEFFCLKATADSGIIICGATTSIGAGTYDILLAKSDLQGNISWAYTYGGIHTDASYDLRIVPTGFVLSGYTESFGHGHRNDSTNIFLMKTDLNGGFLWMQTYGDGLQDEGFHCALDVDGGFLLPAFTTNYLLLDSTQMLLIKTDSNGVSGCHEQPAIPNIGSYPLTPTVDTFTVQHITSIDTLVLLQNIVSINTDDACLFVAIKENILNEQLIIYPVPASEFLSVHYEKVSGTILIRSTFGSIVKVVEIVNGTTFVNVANLANGLYSIELNVDGLIKQKSICIIH